MSRTFTDLTRYYPDVKRAVPITYIIGGLGCLLKSLEMHQTHGHLFTKMSFDDLLQLDEQKLLNKKIHSYAVKKLMRAFKKIRNQEIALNRIKKHIVEKVPALKILQELEKMLPSSAEPIVGRISTLIVEILLSLGLNPSTAQHTESKELFLGLCLIAETNNCFDIRQIHKLKKIRTTVLVIDTTKKTFPYLKRKVR